MLYFPPFRLDIVNGLLWRGEQIIHLPPKPQAVLRYLIERKGRIVSSSEIRQTVWQDVTVAPGIIKVAIQTIRKALGDNSKHPQFIETVAGAGYRFVGAVQHLGPGNQRQAESVTVQDSITGANDSVHASLFVGRDAELRQLYGWLNKALTGQRQIVFVAGEPGLGKTALLRAFQRQLATVPQIWIAFGHCTEHYGVGEAYLPFLDALTRLQMEQQRAALVPLLQQHAPTWLAQLPSLTAQEQRTQVAPHPTATRERMLREFAYMIEALTKQAPLVLVLEDLHWSDPSTLDLLLALAQRQDAARLLLIGTYRPEVIYADSHPFRCVFYDLQARRLCSELTLVPLTEAETHAYLTAVFPTNTFRAELTHVLQERTEGNPLFLTSLLETFVNRGIFDYRHGAWSLTQPIEALAKETPVSFRLLLERQSERLTEEEQRLLAAASVVGLDFSAAAVAHALEKDIVFVETHCESLARRRQFLRATGVCAWPDGTQAAQYAFLHALTREAWNERIPAAQKQRFHHRVGERLEAAYRTREEEIAVELAMHFEAGRDTQRAVRYHHVAGEKASRHLAYREALTHFSAALSLLHASPTTTESSTLELSLQLALTHPLIALQGWAAEETQQAYQRAYELSEMVGGQSEQFTALFGLWVVAYTRAELRVAYELAQQLRHLAQRRSDAAQQMEAYHALGNTLHRMGNLPLARRHLARGIALYDRQRHRSQAFLYGLDNGVAGLGYAAWVLWALGYPDQAQQKTDAMLALAQELSHPLNIAWALNSAAWHYQFQRTSQSALQYAEAEIALCEEHHFLQLRAVGLIAKGWALARQQQPREGIRLMEAGLAAVKQTGATIGQPRYLTVLAEAYIAVGHNDKAVALLAQAEQCRTATGEDFYAAELHRLRGEAFLNVKGDARRTEAILSLSPAVSLAAEESFHKAIAIARQQRAKSFELRAVMSLCELWQLRGQEALARQSLRKIYNWFREGFTTPDLQAARALLAELNQQAA